MINKKEYHSINFPSDQTMARVKDACQSMTEFMDSCTISEAICETADSLTPCYYAELYETAGDVAKWVDEAFEEGLIDTGRGKHPVRLHECLMTGWYLYLEETIRTNMNEIIFNFMWEIADNDPRIPDDWPYWEQLAGYMEHIAENAEESDTFGMIAKQYRDCLYVLGVGDNQ